MNGKKSIFAELENRVLILDGAMGTMLQDRGYLGCCDLHSIINPTIVSAIHREYLHAGADIITTNSFGSSPQILNAYGIGEKTYSIARNAALLARQEVDDYMTHNPNSVKFVAGSVGPAETYREQLNGLLDGGTDIILIETITDASSALAALDSIKKITRERDIEIPVMLSATIRKQTGTLLSGQTVREWYSTVRHHSNILSIGLNCSFGPEHILPYLRELADCADCYVSCHSNAGLPNENGLYDETPESFALKLRPAVSEHFVNIVGGCCGTTPAHIKALAQMLKSI